MGKIVQNKRALLITGTIIPNSNFVEHINVEQRRQEYIDGLVFYSSQFPNDVLFFLENSAYNFDKDEEFQKLFIDKHITLMKFKESSCFNEGKGYQEFEMLDSAFAQLESQYDEFIKITGRYKVLNLKQLTNHKCVNMIADSHKKSKVTQTNVFYVTSRFYITHLKGSYLKVNDSKGKFIEHVVYDILNDKSILSSVELFNKNPLITGFSGSYGGTLNRNKYKMIFRNFERKVLSLLGIHQFVIEY
jgi:hypothetical protein